MVFFPRDSPKQNHCGLVTVSSLTDRIVASQVLGRCLTTSYPLCLVAMEAASQMERLGLDMRLSRTPREVNSEADALSNFRFDGFCPSRRIDVSLEQFSFDVLGSWDGQARDYYLAEHPKALGKRDPIQKSFTKPIGTTSGQGSLVNCCSSLASFGWG